MDSLSLMCQEVSFGSLHIEIKNLHTGHWHFQTVNLNFLPSQ